MSTVQTYTGQLVNLLDPDPATIRFTDIVMGLSRINRFNGATLKPWNVLRHSLLCEALLNTAMPAHIHLRVLLHDVHETWLGDITTPVAQALFDEQPSRLDVLKDRLDDAVRVAFGMKQPSAATIGLVSAADHCALKIERAMNLEPCEWHSAPHYAPTRNEKITYRSIAVMTKPDAREYFGNWAARLLRECGYIPLESLGL